MRTGVSRSHLIPVMRLICDAHLLRTLGRVLMPSTGAFCLWASLAGGAWLCMCCGAADVADYAF